MKRVLLTLLVLAGLCGRVDAAQSVAQCAPRDTRNGGRLCVTLGFRDGHLVVDRTVSKLNASPLFTRRLTRMTLEQAKASLFEQVDRTLADRPRPYELALADGEKGAGAAGPADPLTAELRAFSGSFQAYRPKFEAWAAAAPGRKPFAAIFYDSDVALTRESGLYYPLNTIGAKTALAFNDNNDADLGRGYDLGTATFSFTVTDPIADWSDPEQVLIEFPDIADAKKQAARRRRIQDQLKSFGGRVWDPPAVKNRIVAYYRQFGLTPTVLGGGATDRPRITIIEAPRIAGIVLPARGDKESDDDYNVAIDKILYVLMSDADFRAFIARRADIIVPLPSGLADAAGASGPTVDYQSDLGREGPYLNETRLQVQQLLLSQIGYVSSRQQGEQSDVKQEIFLAVQKIAATRQAPKNTPKPAPATATQSGVVTAHQQEDARATELTPTDKPAGEPLKEHKNYLGFGFEYRPGQGVRFFALGQRSRLNFPFQDSSVSATVGGSDGGGLGSFNYFADYVGFGTLHRRLSLQANFSSDLDPNRVMASRLVDERRTTGMARAEFEPFRDKSGSLLRLFAEMRQAVVALDEEDGAAVKQHLTTLDAGGLFTYESARLGYPKRLRLEPRLRFGLGLAAGAPAFTKLTLAGGLHQALPRRLAADISGTLGIASADTPSFELPSLGGADTVRGFRRDDALGRRLWSLQSELWLPLPHTAADDAKGFKAFLRDNVRLAPFADVGGLYLPSASKAGVRSGYGLGLRVIYNVITFKLDYAYGVGAAAAGGSRGKFYFSIATNLPF